MPRVATSPPSVQPAGRDWYVRRTSYWSDLRKGYMRDFLDGKIGAEELGRRESEYDHMILDAWAAYSPGGARPGCVTPNEVARILAKRP